MDEIAALLDNGLDCLVHSPPTHQPILGIAGDRTPGHAGDPPILIVGARAGVVGRHQAHVDTVQAQRLVIRLDRRRHTVDARKVNVGNHHDTHCSSSI